MAVYVLVDNLKCQAPYFQRKILKQHGSIGRKRYYSALGQPTAIKLLNILRRPHGQQICHQIYLIF